MFKYDANDTMKLLGKQSMTQLNDIEPNFGDILKNIMTANGFPEKFIGDKLLMMGTNLVQYGVILGKRIERKRNKSKYGLSASQRDYMRAILEIVQNDVQSEDSCMSYKLRIASMLSAMRNENCIVKSYHYIRARYQREGEQRDIDKESEGINENYRNNIKKRLNRQRIPTRYVVLIL